MITLGPTCAFASSGKQIRPETTPFCPTLNNARLRPRERREYRMSVCTENGMRMAAAAYGHGVVLPWCPGVAVCAARLSVDRPWVTVWAEVRVTCADRSARGATRGRRHFVRQVAATKSPPAQTGVPSDTEMLFGERLLFPSRT